MKHGTTHAYKHRGCRCDDCRAAARRSITLWRLRTKTNGRGHNPALPDLIDAAPIREHLARLHASGHTWREIAREVGMTHEGVRSIANGTVARTNRRNAAAILDLCPLPDPRTVVDDIAVRRVIDEHADVSTLNAAEKREAIRQGIATRGWNWTQRVLRANGATIRSALAEEAAA